MAHSEVISNAVENIAFRLSEQHEGPLAPAELLSYLPVSLEMITAILDEAAEESAGITAETTNGLCGYSFNLPAATGRKAPPVMGLQCVCCDQEVRTDSGPLCSQCETELEKALKKEAENNAWPAQAIYEHEICYLAARMKSPVSAEKLASSSRFTLRRMRKKLDCMQQALAVHAQRDSETGTWSYTFPPAPYPRERYLKNIQLIRTFPASVTEDIEARIVHILTAIGILFLAMLALAFCAFPFPLLLLFFLITSPILAVVIWKRRLKHDSMEVE